MADAIKSLTRIQIGKESTRGTGVAATRKILTKDATYRNLETLEEFAEQMTGELGRSSVPPIVTRTGTEFEFSNDLDFEQILWFLLSGVKGAVTPTTPGSGEARLWTFTPSMTADPAIEAYTLEYEEGDGTNVLEQEAPYCITIAFEISGPEEGVPQITASLVARKTVLSTATASLTLPAVNFASTARWAVYIDGTWANLGTTQITGQVHSFTFRFSDFIYVKYALDNRSDLDFSHYAWKPRVAEITMEVSVDPNSGLVPDEDGNKTAGTMRFVRLQLNGAAFASPDNGLNHFIRLDGAYFHAPDSMSDRGAADGDGNNTTTLHLLSTIDATQSQDVEMAVQNKLTAFP